MAVNYIHEKQIRQLCCVHAVNNLLQIDAYSACPLASKHEFDQLADELTKQEKALMLSEDSTTISLTLWDKLFSRHRTILLGNYSYEVRLTQFAKSTLKTFCQCCSPISRFWKKP